MALMLLTISVHAEEPQADWLAAHEAQIRQMAPNGTFLTASVASDEHTGFVFALNGNTNRIFAFQVIQNVNGIQMERLDAEPERPGYQGFQVEATGVESIEIETTDSGTHRLRLIPSSTRTSSAASQSVIFDPARIGTGHPFRLE